MDWAKIEAVVNGTWSSLRDAELQHINDREFIASAKENDLSPEEAEEAWDQFSDRVFRVFHVYSPLASGR